MPTQKPITQKAPKEREFQEIFIPFLVKIFLTKVQTEKKQTLQRKKTKNTDTHERIFLFFM